MRPDESCNGEGRSLPSITDSGARYERCQPIKLNLNRWVRNGAENSEDSAPGVTWVFFVADDVDQMVEIPNFDNPGNAQIRQQIQWRPAERVERRPSPSSRIQGLNIWPGAHYDHCSSSPFFCTSYMPARNNSISARTAPQY